MINFMDWKQCEREFIRKVEKDPEKVKALIDTATKRLDLLKKIEPTKDNISFIVEGHYEVIKELLVAYLLKNGLKSKNHQCLITYFYLQNKDHEYEANIIAQMSFYRNRLDYYGELIPHGFWDKNKEKIREIIELLFKILENTK